MGTLHSKFLKAVAFAKLQRKRERETDTAALIGNILKQFLGLRRVLERPIEDLLIVLGCSIPGEVTGHAITDEGSPVLSIVPPAPGGTL